MADNTEWLEKRFGGYDLLHLDPLLLDLVEPEDGPGPGLVLWNQTKEAVSGLSFWKKTDEAAPEPGSGKGTKDADPDVYLKELVTATGLSPGRRSLLEFFDSGGLLDRLRSDHELRAEIVEQVENAPKGLAGSTSLSDVASVAAAATSDDGKRVSSARQPGSVIVIQDTILNKIGRLPPEMIKTLQIPHLDDGRRLDYVLSDRSFRLLGLDRPAVPLVVSGEAADRWAPEVKQFFAAGWYPYVLVLGRYRVTGGRPYIDALAVLAKRYPPIHQILLPGRGGKAGHSLQEMLEKTGDKPKTPTGQTDFCTEGLHLLEPLLMFGLCCEVNGVDLALLKSRAQPLYDAYQECVSRLVKQGSEWDQQGQASPLVDMVRQGRGKTLPIFTEDDKLEQYPSRALRTR